MGRGEGEGKNRDRKKEKKEPFSTSLLPSPQEGLLLRLGLKSGSTAAMPCSLLKSAYSSTLSLVVGTLH